MKPNAPENMYIPQKIYLPYKDGKVIGIVKETGVPYKSGVDGNIEYTRTDVSIEKALKWYCLDCECNDNCKDTKCFFHNAYKRYLEGDTNNLPPKFSNTILNEDGSTSDNWRYRHFTSKMQDAFIEKAAEWLSEIESGTTITDIDKFIEDFKNYMKGE